MKLIPFHLNNQSTALTLKTGFSSLSAVKARYVYILCCLFLLLGCQDTTSDLKEFVDEAYKNKSPKIDALPEMTPYFRFTYASSDEQDPFSFSNIDFNQGSDAANSSEQAPDTNRRKEKLESYPLNALKLVGTAEIGNKPYVIVQSADGTAHRATIGNYMGENDGHITDISLFEQSIVLSELVLNASGRWISREVEFSIEDEQ